MTRPLLLALALLSLAPASALRAQDLEPLVERVTSAWKRGDASAIASFASGDGVSLDIGGARVGPLPPRQAAAALRKLFESVETVSVRSGMAKHVSGSPKRAFVEINWTTRLRGTTVPQRSTVFLALVLERDRWRVTEIRHIT
jgi:hypothetical protein